MHSYCEFTSVFPCKNNDKGLVNNRASLCSHAILPAPVCGAICCKSFEAQFKIFIPRFQIFVAHRHLHMFIPPGWNFRSRPRNLLPTSECCTRTRNIRTPGQIFRTPLLLRLYDLLLPGFQSFETPGIAYACTACQAGMWPIDILSPGKECSINVNSYTWWMAMQTTGLWPDQFSLYIQICKFHSTAVEININTN